MLDSDMQISDVKTKPECSASGANCLDRRHCILGLSGRTSADISAPARLLVVGDSLSAEYGLKRGAGWVALLDARLKSASLDVVLVNASISGETSAGGKARLDALLRRHTPTHVVIELGANDALRGLPLSETRANLAEMCSRCEAFGARAMLIGLQVPPNYGAAYARDFAAMFEQVSRERRVVLVPFLLQGIADASQTQRWFQPDRIHPNESAQPVMLNNVWQTLRPWLQARAPARPSGHKGG
jgi:acyl-CoA thioesterase I